MRDSQKSKVYKAEPSVLAHHSTKLTMGECELLVAKILADKHIIATYGKRMIDVDYGRGGGVAYSRKITLGVWARQTMIVVHEVAHVLAGVNHGHDWKFCATFLDLTERFVSKAAAADLKASFKANKVKFTKPRPPRQMAPEHREAAIARLAVARAARTKPATAPAKVELSNAMIDTLADVVLTVDRGFTYGITISPRDRANTYKALERRGLIELTHRSNYSNRTFNASPTEAGIAAENVRRAKWNITAATLLTNTAMKGE